MYQEEGNVLLRCVPQLSKKVLKGKRGGLFHFQYHLELLFDISIVLLIQQDGKPFPVVKCLDVTVTEFSNFTADKAFVCSLLKE